MSSLYFGPAEAFEDQDLLLQKRGELLPAEDYSGEEFFLLFVPRGLCSEELQTLKITSAQSRLLLILEEEAEAHVRVQLECSDADSFHATEVFVGDSSRLTLLLMQESSAPNVTIRQRSSVGENASLSMQNISLGSGDLDHTLLSDVRGAHAVSSVDWLFYSGQEQRQHIDARNVFHAKEGGGEILMKGVAEDRAHTVCTGMIDIELGGGGTNTYLTEDVLMLDSTAKVDAVPGLEIKTNDVKASHSATISKVTENDLFYFASRGIPERTAREMFVTGFLGALTERIADEKSRSNVLAAIERKYNRS